MGAPQQSKHTAAVQTHCRSCAAGGAHPLTPSTTEGCGVPSLITNQLWVVALQSSRPASRRQGTAPFTAAVASCQAAMPARRSTGTSLASGPAAGRLPEQRLLYLQLLEYGEAAEAQQPHNCAWWRQRARCRRRRRRHDARLRSAATVLYACRFTADAALRPGVSRGQVCGLRVAARSFPGSL